MALHNFKRIVLVTWLTVVTVFIAVAQPSSRISIDFRGGMPSTLTKAATPVIAPFGGTAVRYSFNPYISLSVDANGGVISGRTTSGFFRNNFILYGGKVHFNTTALIKNRSDAWSRLNAYLSLGVNNMNYYYKLNKVTGEKNYNTTFFMYDAGLTIRYYCNEMIDFIGGTNINFTQTPLIDNYVQNKYDQFALTYVGLSIKLLPYERKQSPDWSHIDLPYSTGTMAVTKQLVKDLELDLKEQNQKSSDSITTAIRSEIQTVDKKMEHVDTKVDSVDAKLNLVLDLLNKINTQGIEITRENSINAKPEHNGETPVKKSAPANSKTNPLSATPEEQPDKDNGGHTSSKSTYPKISSKESKLGVVDQNKVKESYAIVLGSFLVDENALKYRERYTNKGWDAHILGNVTSPYKRIVIFNNNYYESAKIVTELRTTEKEDVWMLDINTGKGIFVK